MLPKGSLSAEVDNDKAIVSSLKNIRLNLTTLSNEYLHTLETGVTAELRAREQRALNIIRKYREHNEQMFIEKTSTIDTWMKLQQKNEHTATVVS